MRQVTKTMESCATPVAYCEVPTPLGTMRLAANATALSGAWFLDQKDLHDITEDWHQRDHPVLTQARLELEQWFQQQRRHFADQRGGSRRIG